MFGHDADTEHLARHCYSVRTRTPELRPLHTDTHLTDKTPVSQTDSRRTDSNRQTPTSQTDSRRTDSNRQDNRLTDRQPSQKHTLDQHSVRSTSNTHTHPTQRPLHTQTLVHRRSSAHLQLAAVDDLLEHLLRVVEHLPANPKHESAHRSRDPTGPHHVLSPSASAARHRAPSLFQHISLIAGPAPRLLSVGICCASPNG
jgi:hypothetical protein